LKQEIRVAQDVHAVNGIYDEVRQLYQECFRESLPGPVWDQFYRHCPRGAGAAVLVESGGKLMGFYGLIPQFLVDSEQEELQYLLGMTLMLHPDVRGASVLTEMMKATSDYARENRFSFVMGFPNENSYFPLTRLCRWTMIEEAGCYRFKVKSPKAAENFKALPVQKIRSKEKWRFPYENREYMNWRSMRHAYKLVSVAGRMEIAYKKFGDTLDVIDAESLELPENALEMLEQLALEEGCRSIFITDYHKNRLGIEKQFSRDETSDYKLRFCVLSCGKALPESIHLSLVMSDVY
jgi:hypothetical protein